MGCQMGRDGLGNPCEQWSGGEEGGRGGGNNSHRQNSKRILSFLACFAWERRGGVVRCLGA